MQLLNSLFCGLYGTHNTETEASKQFVSGAFNRTSLVAQTQIQNSSVTAATQPIKASQTQSQAPTLTKNSNSTIPTTVSPEVGQILTEARTILDKINEGEAGLEEAAQGFINSLIGKTNEVKQGAMLDPSVRSIYEFVLPTILAEIDWKVNGQNQLQQIFEGQKARHQNRRG